MFKMKKITSGRQKYLNNYDKTHYMHFNLRIKKSKAEDIKNFIKEYTNLSFNGFVNMAIDDKIKSIKAGGNNFE